MTPMIMGLPGGAEWILLLLVALLIFGGTRLAGLGKGAGQAVREFREETRDLRKKDEKQAVAGAPAVDVTPAVPTTPAGVPQPSQPVEAEVVDPAQR